MLPLHVGWCLPLPIPSSKIALPTQKTHKLPYLKTHNPHATLPKNLTKNSQPTRYPTPKNSTKNSQPTRYPSKKHTCERMSSHSKVLGWECGTCAYTNKDARCRDCLAFQARRPVCYAILASATGAATARTMRVDHPKQARVTALPTVGPVVTREAATSTNGAIAGEAPNAAYGPPAVAGGAAMHHRLAPQLGSRIILSITRLISDGYDDFEIVTDDQMHLRHDPF